MLSQILNIQNMYKTVREGKGFDWIIVVSSGMAEADFWQSRLELLKGQIIGENTKIVSQSEDWPGGAGELLGTIYAWQKANRLFNLEKELKQGKKIAIYHTAGFGKRMAPLSLSEELGKTAIKLPKLLKINSVIAHGAGKNVRVREIDFGYGPGIIPKKDFITLLEAVIFSTQIYAPTRESRLTVFWGDQIIIPSREPGLEEEGPVEIFCQKRRLPNNEKEWEKHWERYGVLLPTSKGILQREKISWAEFLNFKPELDKKQPGRSLGFFSVSPSFLKELLKEFGAELKARKGRLDIELSLWVPLTCGYKEYKNYGGNTAHWRRVQALKNKFSLAAKDLGQDCFWWDFGGLKNYQRNLLKTLEPSLEGQALRKFFGLERFWKKRQKSPGLSVENSILVDSKIGGKIKNCVICGAQSQNLKLRDSLLFNVEAPCVMGEKALAYNLQERLPIDLKKQDVLTDIFSKVGKIRVKTKTFRDGKKDWEKKIYKNSHSYQEIQRLV